MRAPRMAASRAAGARPGLSPRDGPGDQRGEDRLERGVHDEALGTPQVVGGLLTVGAVIWVKAHRADLEQESSPGWSTQASGLRADSRV